MHLQRRKTQHYVTCCVTRFVTWSHRSMTCKRDDVWEAWYCPVTVYCTRTSLIFSEVISSKKCEKTSRDVEPQKCDSLCNNLWQIWYYLCLPKARGVLQHYDPEVLPTNVNKILMNTVVLTTLKHIYSNVDS